MSFDFDAALAEILADAPAISAIPAINTQNQRYDVAISLRHTRDSDNINSGIATQSQKNRIRNNLNIKDNRENRRNRNAASQTTPLPGYSSEAIRQGVAEAFADWEAMNRPHDPRAWE